jgi:hypothetical protein
MIGMTASDLNLPPPAPAAPPAQAAAAPLRAQASKTMLGVAMPGIAPLAPGVAADPSKALPSQHKTMLGVAMPGIAPTRTGPEAPIAAAPQRAPVAAPAAAPRAAPPQPVEIVPPPAPISDIELPPAAPRIVRRTGVPLAVVAALIGALVLFGGVAIVLLWRGSAPMTAQPLVGADGRELLHLTCASCKDGTVAELDGVKATFAAGSADLPMATPLHVGDNSLTLHVDRPGMGRDESVKIVVPIVFRVRADVSTALAPAAGARPAITVRVETAPGATVTVDDKPLALDASGVGAYAVDLGTETEGPSDESKVVSREIPYVVTTKGRPPEKGTVSARVAIAPLRVDTPGAHAVVEASSFVLSGRAAKGATVTVNGKAAAVAPDGSFEATLDAAAVGDVPVEVRAGGASLAPRTVRINVKRVASLDAEAKSFEAQTNVDYDAAMADLAGKAGATIVVEGAVVESRVSGHRTLVLVDDKRGCAKGPCIARVVIGDAQTLAHGDPLRAYGRVTKAFTTASGTTVPEVEADFVIKGKAK